MTERISIQQAADALGVHPATIRRYIADGSLPAERIGKQLIRVRRADVEVLARPIRTVDRGYDR